MKKRLDTVLVEKGLVKSRQQARAFIMAGEVTVDGRKVTKAGTFVKDDAQIELKIQEMSYVSRGGLKLEEAIKTFDIDVNEKICLDAGASTGGFTDCLLKHGAKLVYAIDVGYGQLDWKLRNDERVVVIEKVNIRYLAKEDFFNIVSNPEAQLADIATIDVSFISLEKILPRVFDLTKENAKIIALIKPQFEAGREKVSKGGVVKDEKVRKEVVERIKKFAVGLGFVFEGVVPSPIKGPAGNTEYLMYLTKE
ncbi:MAG: TlyA family RNA methyltransferase [bacterium]